MKPSSLPPNLKKQDVNSSSTFECARWDLCFRVGQLWSEEQKIKATELTVQLLSHLNPHMTPVFSSDPFSQLKG